MDPTRALHDGRAHPSLTALFTQRKMDCLERKQDPQTLLSLLALFQDFSDLAPRLAFDKGWTEPLKVPAPGEAAYWFTVSLPVVQGNGRLLTYLPDPHKYRFDSRVQEWRIQSDGAYLVATYVVSGDAPDPLPPRKAVLHNLGIHHLRLKCEYVAYEVDRYNEQIRHLFRYDSQWF